MNTGFEFFFDFGQKVQFCAANFVNIKHFRDYLEKNYDFVIRLSDTVNILCLSLTYKISVMCLLSKSRMLAVLYSQSQYCTLRQTRNSVEEKIKAYKLKIN